MSNNEYIMLMFCTFSIISSFVSGFLQQHTSKDLVAQKDEFYRAIEDDSKPLLTCSRI